MIAALPNDPYGFGTERHAGPSPFDRTTRLLVRPDDGLHFQVGATRSITAAGQLDSPLFDDPADWSSSGSAWSIGSNQACFTGSGIAYALTEQSFAPTVGTAYEVEVSVVGNATGRPITVELGGASVEIPAGAVGDFTLQLDAITTQALRIVPGLNGTLCLGRVQVYPANRNLTVAVIDEAGSVVDSWTPTGAPTYFTFTPESATVRVNLKAEDVPDGCYTVRVTDGADNVVLNSAGILIGDHPGTLFLQATNTEDSAGLYFDGTGFVPCLRIHGNLGRSRFEFDAEELRDSRGRRDRPFADRQRLMELRIDHLTEAQHDAVAAFVLWDSFTIDGVAYELGDRYEPDFGDIFEHTAPVILDVRPKVELARKTRTKAEAATGQPPPPNYLVLDAGPSVANPVLLTDGTPIELAE